MIEDLELPRLLLGVLVVAKKPLSLNALLQLLQMHFSQYGDVDDVKHAATVLLGLLSSLITGSRSSTPNAPLLPLHTSFLDFLQNPTSNPKYFIDAYKSHRLLTESCFAVMQSGDKKLMFNICKLTTSFIPNSSIPGLPALIEKEIGEALSYACSFWTNHFSLAPDVAMSTLEAIKTLLSTIQLLYWLEVMSLTGTSPVQSLLLIPAQVCQQYSLTTSQV
ncbi:hypothetical protein DL93DRAFT_49 [Clavulina sp. PMI_390]|nr:hypothetical protein DL93DRAFT_49 [Clavulina sp. PMI_390]